MRGFTGFIVAGLLFISGCSNQTAPQVGGQSSERYQAPADYQAHRDQQQLFASDAGNLAYTDHGSGPVLVMIHGVPTSSWMYRQVIPELQDQLRVISVDLLGYGSSDKPEDTGDVYTAQAHASRVNALLESLGVARYGVMMHDMGGLVAWELLRDQPQALSHLVVLNTIVAQQGFNHPNINPGFFARQMTNAYSSPLTSRAILEKTFDNMGLTGNKELSEDECFGYVEPMREGANHALYAFFTSLNEDLYARLASNTTLFDAFAGETLVIWGGQDEILTTEQIPVLTEHLRVKDENLHIYSDHNHFLAEEMPEELAQQILRFMGS